MADIPNNASTSATLTIGGSLTSAIDSNGDRDWVRIDLGPGQFVEISMEGISLADPFLRIYNADGDLVALNDDFNGRDSQLTIGGPNGGTFYIEAGAYNDSGTGTYELTAVSVPAPSPVDTLDSGLARGDSDNIVTVYFVDAGDQAEFGRLTTDPSADVVSEGWSTDERNAVMTALGVISNYADVSFVISNDPRADFQLVLDDFGDAGLLGYFYLPSNASYTGESMGAFNSGGFGWSNGLTAGGLGFSTVIHEALHGLGLDHPHEGDSVLLGLNPEAFNFPFGDYGDFELNQTVYTIMSYNGGWNGASPTTNSYGDAASPMALDIAMLQELYGANTTHNNGNNTYELASANAVGTGWVAIWDTGGVDTITYSGTRDTVIDLRPATLEYEVGGGGFISNASGIQGGFTIANGVVIENATSGSGNDILVGNDADNVLTGNGGNDLLIGGHGQDTLNGGAGNDDISGGTGSDVIDAGANNDAVDGNSGNDTISTSGGTNTIYGSSGNDQITGGTGADTVYAGSGNDQIIGGGGNDALFGGRGNDTIQGGGGADDITGGLGQDTMTGGSGADVFIFNAISDSWDNNRDTITDFETGTDHIDLSMIDANLSLGGDQAFTFNSGGAPTNTAGEIWATMSGSDTIIFVDQDGDGIADMGITLEDTTGVTAGDFIL
ncbi:M10 family metallopeptidase [Yoonia sp. R78084]|uniref:M10 family metallopeptidase n=1 Tax=Yoonia sp. R78084 TaxID=3093869 RepID=UPI0037DD4074